ncbi:MAG: hypothetical protein KMY50_03110 [Candidatus Desulforudis sp.]|nr:hypothetical protein [Desulforudis sp.]
MDRNEILAELLKEYLQTARIGVVVQGLSDIDPGVVCSIVSNSLGKKLYVSVVGHDTSSAGSSVNLALDIESAVGWRSIPRLSGRIVVFVRGEVAKLHSLNDLEFLTARDVSCQILKNASLVLGENTPLPHKRFWDALAQESDTFPLNMIEDFVTGVQADIANLEAISNNLWRLGLLGDPLILSASQNPRERLQRNRELLVEMGQLSERNRKRIGAVLVRAEAAEQSRLRTAFIALKEFYRRGGTEPLRRLNLSTVEKLLKAGRPLPRSRPVVVPNGEATGNDDPGSTRTERPLRGKALHRATAICAVSRETDAQNGLRQLGEALLDALENPEQQNDSTVVNSGFDGQTLSLELAPQELRQMLGRVCTVDSWGGVIHSTYEDLRPAVCHANLEEIRRYDPEEREQGVAGHSLFSLLRSLGQYLPPEMTFGSILEHLTTNRNLLLQHFDLILTQPIVAFGGYPEARQALFDYLDAFSDLLRLLRQNDASLHSVDPTAIRWVYTELLRLEVVYIRTPSEWKAILTPLHPFHLWKFRELFKAVHSEQPLGAEEQAQLAEALPDLPHLLHFVVFSPDVTGTAEVLLPQSGNWWYLPTYENRTNRYLGRDGLEFLEDLLKRWIEYAPYSKPQVRIGLVDVPDLQHTLGICAAFLGNTGDTRLSVDAYFTRGQKPECELAQLDYENKDHEIAEVLRNGRLNIRLENEGSMGEVLARMQEHPVHIAYLFDQSQYRIDLAPRARQLSVSPLVITYQYEYSDHFNSGTIAPSSEAEEGPFSDYHFVVERAARLPAGQQIRLQHDSGVDLAPITSLVTTGATRWLVVADRVLTDYAPDTAVLLAERRDGLREIGIWTSTSSRVIEQISELLQGYNLYPNPDVLASILNRFTHIAGEGLLSVHASSGSRESREARLKGILGTILTVAWYVARNPGALVASLDSQLARLWLRAHPAGNERADLIGLRMDGSGQLVIEPIEVKTRSNNSDIQVQKDSTTGQDRLVGKSVEQVISVLRAIKPVFGGEDSQPIFTPARREVLKYQLHRECFRGVHQPDWRKEWYYRLREAFAQPEPRISIVFRGLIVHVQLDEFGSDSHIPDESNGLVLTMLRSPSIQQLLSGVDSTSKTKAHLDTEEQASPQTESTSGYAINNVATSQSKAAEPDILFQVPEDLVAATTTGVSTALTTVDVTTEIARLFMRACESYRIQVDECDPNRAAVGPTVVRFYIKLARGQRLDPLRNGLEDIGREMQRSGLLVSSIPNSAEIALDVPRVDRDVILLANGHSCLPTVTSPEQLPITIGVTPEGTRITGDLSNLHHMLVGGTTGAGKTMFLYGLITSLLLTHPSPSALRLFISTSGPEDFVFFEGLPHIEVGRIITDASEAIELLHTHINQEFDQRAELLMNARCRSITEYNAANQPLIPPLVIVVDEFADLADQLAGNRRKQDEFYTYLRRVAQLGRKRGIHLVLCTQRPSADLVPTSIRNLMNARVALRVNDATASRMILDENGAEQLQMHGDLLYKAHSRVIRAQGYYTDVRYLEELLNPLRG